MIDKEKNMWNFISEAMKAKSSYPTQKLLKYSTNIPVLMTCMEVMAKDNIIEFGSGMYSTKIFYDNFVRNFITIEDDKKWYDIITKTFIAKDGFRTDYVGFYFGNNGPGKKLCFKDLNKEQQLSVLEYYEGIAKKYEDLYWDIMFVDQVQYGRGASINSLYKKCKVIICHDSQGVRRNNYEVLGSILKENKHKLFRYKTVPSYSDILISDSASVDIDLFSSVLRKNEKTYFSFMGNINNDFNNVLKKCNFDFCQIV